MKLGKVSRNTKQKRMTLTLKKKTGTTLTLNPKSPPMSLVRSPSIKMAKNCTISLSRAHDDHRLRSGSKHCGAGSDEAGAHRLGVERCVVRRQCTRMFD